MQENTTPTPAPETDLPQRVCCARCHISRHRKAFPMRHAREASLLVCKHCAGARDRRGRRPTPPPPGCRRCRHCHRAKPLESFVADHRAAEGRRETCQTCLTKQRAGTGGKQRQPNPGARARVPRKGLAKEQRVSLGIAIAHATCPPGHCRSRVELAAYAGASEATIRRIEEAALRKMRQGLGAVLRAAGHRESEVRL